ncbi:MAG: lytic transglycosylase domain-containing protein [Stellaceae bacterium]
MVYAKLLVAILVASQFIAAYAMAEKSARLHDPAAVVSRDKGAGPHVIEYDGQTVAPLDRIAVAVDGAESSHGQDQRMWRPDPAGPQGPMQVSEAAATDVGGGNRFDFVQNRAIGRAYLSLLFWRYRNWPDAIAAYNWGIGRMDSWVRAGRPPDKLLVGVAAYLKRVLSDSGLCDGAEPEQVREASGPRAASALPTAACAVPDTWGGSPGFGIGANRFTKKLDNALQLALFRATQSR